MWRWAAWPRTEGISGLRLRTMRGPWSFNRQPHRSTASSGSPIGISVIELAGLTRAYSEPRPGARKIMLMLTDGVPTFPFGQATVADPEDVEAAISAARLARRAGITINTFALGQMALATPFALSEISRLTLGAHE